MNKSNVKKISINKRAMAIALAGTLTTVSLTGCNYVFFHTETFNKAIIFNEDRVTIVEVEKWSSVGDEQLVIQTKDGFNILTTPYDTKLINDIDSDISAEDLVRSIMGEDITIDYLDESKQKTKQLCNLVKPQECEFFTIISFSSIIKYSLVIVQNDTKYNNIDI